MFLLRRTAVRAITSTPSVAVTARPRSIATLTPAAFRSKQQQQFILSSLQRRFASDDAVKKETVETAETASATPENFAQTAAEAPVEENVTAAEPSSDSTPLIERQTAFQSSPTEQQKADRLRPPPNQTIYVGNLFYEVTEDQLKRIFSRFGEIEKASIVYDARGLSRGFGYVKYKNVNDAQSAIDNLDMQVFEGRNLVVQFHKERAERGERAERAARAFDGTPRVNPPAKTLFVGNMPYEMSDKDLNDLFRDVRNVLDVRVAIDRRTGQPRGFAHADFLDIESATEAKEALTGKLVYGRQLRADFTSAPSFDRNRNQRGPRRDEPADQE